MPFLVKFVLALVFCACLSPQVVSAQVAAPIVYVYQSENTNRFFAAANGNYAQLVNHWYAAFERVGQAYEKADLKRLAATKKPGIIVFPSSVLIDEKERQVIRTLAKNGWGILGTWAFGARDGQGAWLGYGFVEEIFQAKVVADFDTRKTNGWFMFPVGESPVSFGLNAGERLFIPKINEPLLTIQSASIAAIGGDWTRQSGLGLDRSGLMSFNDLNGSRRVFWSIPETAWEAARPQLDVLIRNGLSWLKREVSATKAAWPHPHQSAILIEMDTEDQFPNAATLAELMEARQWTGTFYLLGSLAKNHPDIVKRLAAKHELAYHADVHDGFKDLPLASQVARMKNMQALVGGVLGDVSKLSGFRAPLESFDTNTEIAMRSVGMRHHAGSMNSGESMLPNFSKVEPSLGPDQALVVFPRDQLDDVNFLRMGVNEPAKIQQLLIEGAERAMLLRGFSLLSVHTQFMAKGSPLAQSLPKMFDRIADPKAQKWVAPATTFERWWRAREQVKVSQKITGRQVVFSFQNGAAPVRNLTMIVMSPNARSTLKVSNKSTGVPGAIPVAVQAVKLDDYRWAVVIPELREGLSAASVQFD